MLLVSNELRFYCHLCVSSQREREREGQREGEEPDPSGLEGRVRNSNFIPTVIIINKDPSYG